MASGEDQERFEDYLELEHFIEELQAGHVAHPPGELTAEKARIYRMAALFRSASSDSPNEASSRPEFVAELQAKLEQEIQQPPKKQRFPFLTKKPQKRPRVSRRALLTGGAAAAASLAVGAGIDHVLTSCATMATVVILIKERSLRCLRPALIWVVSCNGKTRIVNFIAPVTVVYSLNMAR